ncbi:hypothetical protein F2Q68_00024578 [Brassica cretica]|uniref:Uncharacterized protein n=1 Tax=Brassica cretica TaxID=69181 RepID=A0A8S9IHM2_BRACR|nr:hypothetical protein F2Q68_00024578 [Brassica cretica]
MNASRQFHLKLNSSRVRHQVLQQVRHRVRQHLKHTKDTNEHVNTNAQLDHLNTKDNSATRNVSTNVTTPGTTDTPSDTTSTLNKNTMKPHNENSLSL